MEDDPVQPIQAKVDKLRLWHSFPARFCYVYCRVVFIIVGAFLGAVVLVAAYCVAAKATPDKTPNIALAGIGALAGVAVARYLSALGARLVILTNHRQFGLVGSKLGSKLGSRERGKAAPRDRLESPPASNPRPFLNHTPGETLQGCSAGLAA